MRRAKILQSVAIVMLVVAFTIIAFQISQNRRLIRQGRQAHDALCVFKTDLQSRVADGRKFLEAHPSGIAGISPADIRRSLNNQQATLDSLKTLTCPTEGAAS